MLVVDISIWIDHLRLRPEPELVDALPPSLVVRSAETALQLSIVATS